MSAPTLTGVILESGKRYDAMVIVGDPEVSGVRRHEYIAAAVTAWIIANGGSLGPSEDRRPARSIDSDGNHPGTGSERAKAP